MVNPALRKRHDRNSGLLIDLLTELLPAEIDSFAAYRYACSIKEKEQRLDGSESE
jgi:hypothetical protein